PRRVMIWENGLSCDCSLVVNFSPSPTLMLHIRTKMIRALSFGGVMAPSSKRSVPRARPSTARGMPTTVDPRQANCSWIYSGRQPGDDKAAFLVEKTYGSSSDECRSSWQDNPDLGECMRLGSTSIVGEIRCLTQ